MVNWEIARAILVDLSKVAISCFLELGRPREPGPSKPVDDWSCSQKATWLEGETDRLRHLASGHLLCQKEKESCLAGNHVDCRLISLVSFLFGAFCVVLLNHILYLVRGSSRGEVAVGTPIEIHWDKAESEPLTGLDSSNGRDQKLAAARQRARALSSRSRFAALEGGH